MRPVPQGSRSQLHTLFWGMSVPRPLSPAMVAMRVMARGRDATSLIRRRHAIFSLSSTSPPLSPLLGGAPDEDDDTDCTGSTLTCMGGSGGAEGGASVSFGAAED